MIQFAPPSWSAHHLVPHFIHGLTMRLKLTSIALICVLSLFGTHSVEAEAMTNGVALIEALKAQVGESGVGLAGNAGFDAQQAVLTDSSSAANLLSNGNFESGTASWTQSSSDIIGSDSNLAHGGSGYAWLGGYPNARDTLYHDVALAANLQAVSLTFWYYVATKEGSTAAAHDVLTIELYNIATGAKLATLGSFSNINRTSDWTQSPKYDLSAYKGQSIRLKFTGVTDAVDNTNFFIDDVVIAGTTAAAASTVVEFYNSVLDNYFITANAGEAAAIDGGSAGPGWSRTGNAFYSGGDTPVCRFYGSYSPGPNSHFYTADATDCNALKALQASTPATQKRWNFEGLDFVVSVPVNGVCKTGTVPVYRAYNNGFARGVDSNHRITANLASIQQVVARGWSNEGVVMCVAGIASTATTTPPPTTTPPTTTVAAFAGTYTVSGGGVTVTFTINASGTVTSCSSTGTLRVCSGSVSENGVFKVSGNDGQSPVDITATLNGTINSSGAVSGTYSGTSVSEGSFSGNFTGNRTSSGTTNSSGTGGVGLAGTWCADVSGNQNCWTFENNTGGANGSFYQQSINQYQGTLVNTMTWSVDMNAHTLTYRFTHSELKNSSTVYSENVNVGPYTFPFTLSSTTFVFQGINFYKK